VWEFINNTYIIKLADILAGSSSLYNWEVPYHHSNFQSMNELLLIVNVSFLCCSNNISSTCLYIPTCLKFWLQSFSSILSLHFIIDVIQLMFVMKE
jgi:hypothetical protein